MRKQVVAVCCADIHLTLHPPVARAGEKDWLKAQARPLDQLKELACEYKVPVLCAGDVFDRWNSSPELINWALDHLPPHFVSIPGQHDLPTHNYELIHKSAYMTLAKAHSPTRGIQDLVPGGTLGTNDLNVRAFPWGHPLTPAPKDYSGLMVALVHQYAWVVGSTYPGAPEEARITSKMKALKGWDVVIFGDNHKGFLTKAGDTTVFNCGGLQRRKSDEIGYKPQVGLLFNDGSITPQQLDVSSDIIAETSRGLEPMEDMELDEFLEELSKLQESELDFEEAMNRMLRERKPGPLVRELILNAMKR